MAGSDIQRSELNRLAAAYIERARKSLEPAPTMDEFLAQLSRTMEVSVPYTRYNGWESGRSLVPAAALVAMFRLSGLPVADPEGERTLAERLQRLEAGLEALRSEFLERLDIRPLGGGALQTRGIRS